MITFSLTLTEQDLNYAMNAIAQRPYAECFGLIRNIEAQVQQQLAPKEAANESDQPAE